MKNCIQFIALFFCFLVFAQDRVAVLPVASENPTDFNQTNIQRERIVSFQSDVTISENADVTVTETIQVFANGDAIKRGIFRALPTLRNINGGKEKIFYKIIAVEKDGAKEPYNTKKENGIFTIYIGNKDQQLEPGFIHTKLFIRHRIRLVSLKAMMNFTGM